MEAWHCYDFGDDGKYELISYPDITCDGSDMRWLGIMIFSFFSGIFFIIGVNSIYFCILKNIKTTDETMVRRYGFIFLRYVEDCYMWELVTNIRKIFTIIAGVALSRSGVGQVCMMLVVVIIMLALQYYFEPYEITRSNNLEKRLLLIQIGQLILTLIWEITGLNEDTMSGLMLFVLGCGIILVIIELALIIYDMKVERDDRIKKDNIAWNNHLKKEKKLKISYLLGSECTDTRSDKKCWLEDQRKQKMMKGKTRKYL